MVTKVWKECRPFCLWKPEANDWSEDQCSPSSWMDAGTHADHTFLRTALSPSEVFLWVAAFCCICQSSCDSILEDSLETRKGCSTESTFVWTQHGKTQDYLPLSFLALRNAVARLIPCLGC